MTLLRALLLVSLLQVAVEANKGGGVDVENFLTVLGDFRYNSESTNSLEALLLKKFDDEWQDLVNRLIETEQDEQRLETFLSQNREAKEIEDLFNLRAIYQYIKNSEGHRETTFKNKKRKVQKELTIQRFNRRLQRFITEAFMPFQSRKIPAYPTMAEVSMFFHENKIEAAIDAVVDKMYPDSRRPQGTRKKPLKHAIDLKNVIMKYIEETGCMHVKEPFHIWLDHLFDLYLDSIECASDIQKRDLEAFKDYFMQGIERDQKLLYGEVRYYHLSQKLSGRMLYPMKKKLKLLQNAHQKFKNTFETDKDFEPAFKKNNVGLQWLPAIRRRINKKISQPLRDFDARGPAIREKKYDHLSEDEKNTILTAAKTEYDNFEAEVKKIEEKANELIKKFERIWGKKIEDTNIHLQTTIPPTDLDETLFMNGYNVGVLEYTYCAHEPLEGEKLSFNDVVITAAFNMNTLKRLSKYLHVLLNIFMKHDYFDEIKTFTEVIQKKRESFLKKAFDNQRYEAILEHYERCMDLNLVRIDRQISDQQSSSSLGDDEEREDEMEEDWDDEQEEAQGEEWGSEQEEEWSSEQEEDPGEGPSSKRVRFI